MSLPVTEVTGAGLGLRRALMGPLRAADEQGLLEPLGFLELTPENWIGVGGRTGRQLHYWSERFPFICHGLSLSLGAPEPLDEEYLDRLGAFLDQHQVRIFSEHLSYCSEHGHLYDLMPIPFTLEALEWTAGRIRRVQEHLGRSIAVENISYYAAPGQEISELEFICGVLDAADCLLLLDVNNLHVNSINHRYDAQAFLDGLPASRIAYLHVAGHHNEADDLIIDTHGAPVIDPVWQLLDAAYRRCGPLPTLLERDFNFPPVSELMGELNKIQQLQRLNS